MSIYALNSTFVSVGTINSTARGAGSFSLLKTDNEDGSKSFSKILKFGEDEVNITRNSKKNEDGSKTITGTRVDADGKTKTFNQSVVKNADGSKTITRTIINDEGKTTTISENIKKNEDGSFTITGTKTLPNGKVITIAGTKVKTEDGFDIDKTFTNDKGKTAELHRDISKDGDITTIDTDRTGFRGKHFEDHTIYDTDITV